MIRIPTCREMSELVTDYLERALPTRPWLEARLHLLLCPPCQRYYDQMRRTIGLLGRRPLSPPNAVTERDVLARLRDAGPPSS